MTLSARRQLPILLIAFAALALSLTGEPTQAQENLARTPPGVGQDVCYRTDEVRDAIVSASGAATCEDITLRRIREITSLKLSNQGISSLSVGDFDGLVRLDTLDLSGNDLTGLPQGVFDELLLLKTLHLDGNQLQSLPVRLFDELLLLEELTLHSNPQLSLPDGMFGDFSRFAGLQPDGSRWGSQTLEGFLQKHGVSTAEQFIDSLPTDHKQRFAMVYTSESPAVAHVSGDYPRIASWGGDGRFTFAWNTDPDAPSEFSEVMEFLRQGDDRWSAGIIDFSGDAPSITEPASCQVCHGSLNKPLWGAYLNWDGTEYVDPTDTEGIEATKSAMDSTNPRIEPLDFSESYFRSRRDGHARFLKTGGYENFFTVVEEGGTVWSLRHAEVLFHRLKARENYWAVAEETMCKTKTSVNFGNTAREHAVGLFTPGEQNPAVMSNTGEGIQGGSIGDIHVAPDYFYTGSAHLGGALVFLMVVDLWEREPIVRKLYRDVSNADTILPSAPVGAELLLFYEPGEATAEDELIQKLRLHFGAGGPVARAALGSQNTYGFWSSTFFAGHLDVMGPRVCDALTKTKPKSLNVTLNAGDALLSWDTPEDVSSLTGYRILRGTDGEAPTVYLADTGTTDTTWTDSGLVPGEYVWIVQALFDGYPSPESNAVRKTVAGSGHNRPATGAPIISGAAQVGETLTASTSDIDDADGMSGAVFSHQWLADDADIAGATGPTYTPVAADKGKSIKVRVSFIDEKNNPETLTSATTTAVLANVPGAPEHLKVSTHNTGALDVSWEAPATDGGSAITEYRVQWKETAGNWDTPADVSEETVTSTTHTITGLTDGVEYAVRVIAVNDAGDGPPSDEATGTPRETTPPELSTATVDGATLTLTYDEDLDENSEPSPDAFSVTVGGTGRAVAGVSVSGSSVILTLGSAVTSEETVTVSYAAPADTAALRIKDLAGNPAASFSDELVTNNTPPPANTPATGAPTITGTAQVGETLTVETSAIDDADGLDNVNYSYKWLANGADIAGAMDPTYTLVDDDAGLTIKVQVSFFDDKNNPETLTSAATAVVEAAAPAPGPITGFTVVDASDQSVEGALADGGTLALDNPDGGSFGIRADLESGATIGSMSLYLTGAKTHDQTENITPYSLYGDSGGNLSGESLPVGEYTLTATAYSEARLGGDLLGTLKVSFSVTETATQQPNTPATGAPAISGTAQVGETLTVDISGIDDADGIGNATFSYQWIAGTTDISGATGSSYAPLVADLGKTIKVRVTFMDGAINVETLTSEATAAVAPKPNTPATGLPTISGTAQVGDTLTADISGIGDADGLDNVGYSYQWLADDTEIAGATDPTYTLVADDVGKAIRVRVSFFDDENNPETLTSEATATAVTPLTAEFQDAPDKHLGTGVFTFEIAFSEPISIGYVTLRDDSLDVTNGSATKAKRVSGQSDLWEITVEPDSDADVTVVLPITEDCESDGAVCTRDGTELSNRSELTVPGPAAANSPPTGAPIISGTARVGETLTVDTSGIDDADGMSGAVFSYQWLANDAEITGATSDTYTLVEADFDKAVKVRVIFNDDDNNEETLTSEATAAVAAETAVPDAPQSLNVSPDDTGTLDVSWEAPASDGGSAITGYKVQWKRAADSWDTPADVFEATATGTTHTITGLTDGVEYAVRVIAVNDVGDGPPSDETTGTPRETTPPELLTATVDGATLTLTLTYDEALDENSEPSSDAFSVTVGGTGRAVDGVSVSGSSVILTLGSAVASGATVTVSYTVPTDAAAPRIQDEAGNPAASFSDQDVENKTPPPANSPATGAPTISGTAQVGETLTAETRDIEDDDGLDNAVFTYQWLANGADINGATSDTYTLVDDDAGLTIQVKVSFRDDKNNPETLTSAATAAVAPRPNSPATGAPNISGTVQVGETLTAETSAIADADGMSGAVFSYQWLADDADISGATSDTYTLVADDVGKAIKVKVSFRDDRNHQESLTSEATAAVTAAADDSSIWSATLTVGSSSSFHGYWKDLMGSLAPDGFNIDGSDYTVTSLSRYGDLLFAFVLDQALPGDFTLQVGDTTLRSEEADVTTSSSSYSYQWQNKIPALSDGDIVEVSLTLAE